MTTALFEKFTERSIKSIMIAQAEARACGAQEVRTARAFLAPTISPVLKGHANPRPAAHFRDGLIAHA